MGVYRINEKTKPENLNVELFRKTEYTEEELNLFCDIAFNRKSERIRKWTTDIKVEIKEPHLLKARSIAEIDSVIAILAPLITPLKIERVWTNGNVHIYRNIHKVALSDYTPNIPIALKGLTKKNKESDIFWDITHASVYVREGAHTQTILHEFEHVLGLEHPLHIYPYYVTIGRSVIPEILYPETEYINFIQSFYISEQEKTAIRMLYSKQINPGLKKSIFLEKMRINE